MAVSTISQAGLDAPITLTSPVINTPTMGGSVITSGTSQASTSGTSIDFTSIPSWVKRITVMFNGVSTNGSSKPMIQIGSGSVLNTGYAGSSSNTATTTAFSSGFIWCENASSNDTRTGSVVLVLLGSNIWVETGLTLTTNGSAIPTMSVGQVTLSGALDRVRITTVNGTDAFDAGSINILYE
jgi:hypothetical protein